MQACACCGAILPAPLSRLDAIPGQEHLRRAVTVALTGNHPITFLGSGGALADALAFGRISRHYGVTAYVTTACICGNAGDPYLACRCSPKAISAWQRRPAFQAALAADLVVEAAHPSAKLRMAHRHGRHGEPDEQVIARAMEARSRPRPSTELDGASQLTIQQARSLLDAVQGDPLEALYHIALSLGLRRGEILGLRPEDIRLEQRELPITSTIQRIRGKLVGTTPKTKTSIRTLYGLSKAP
jgi:hypothetical protein